MLFMDQYIKLPKARLGTMDMKIDFLRGIKKKKEEMKKTNKRYLLHFINALYAFL